MRTLFDQYSHHENRLTHALASCLNEDRRFLQTFVHWATGERPPKGSPLRIVEQRLPGEPEVAEDEAERRGLPDAWIHTDSGWALLVESKVAAPIDPGQIRRHLDTAERRGFSDRRIVILSTRIPSTEKRPEVHHRTWQALFIWLRGSRWESGWPERLAEYMEAAEARMLADGYLREGALTAFTGIHFNEENPYSYLEAKRLLRLLTDEMRTRRTLATILGADLAADGRGAITGSAANSVWDFIPLAGGDGDEAFTRRPHLTLSVGRDRALAQLTIPNGMDGALRKRLVGVGEQGFSDLLGTYLVGVRSLLSADPAAKPFFMVLQRHYPSQRSEPVIDGLLEADLRTAFGTHASHVKVQPEWLAMAFQGLARRKSNLQFSVGISWPYNRSITVAGTGLPDKIETAWLASAPILQAMGLSKDRHRRPR